MATFMAVSSVLEALKEHLELGISPSLIEKINGSPSVTVLGPTELKAGPSAHAVGLYLHRISVDRDGGNRYLQPRTVQETPQPELPVNLHLLLIAWTDTTMNEAPLLGWAMQQIGSAIEFDATHLGARTRDPAWGESDTLRIAPEEMSIENLMRVWDGLPGEYRLSASYSVRTIRLEPALPRTEGPPVRTIVMPTGTA